ncbi:hypothetical protein LPJ61_003720 [Coemansia biformis]|uniref:Uncharacterized protein n=1 Tax=Coemansia biformis TaxID=1286918 RepID=A0A9W7Y633_9FUNG|nr:hypothetical protein LPJ61_003720 [Coemansia biformis]
MNRYWLPEPAEAAAAALPPIPAAHCPSAIADLRRAPPSVPIAASYSTTTMVHDEPLDAAPGLERRASSTGQSVTRSSSGSSTQTLAAGPTARRGFLKRISLIQRSYHLPHCSKKSLQRNNTTKTVSHNELSEDVDDTCRLLPSRSTDFASALEAPGKPSALVGQCTAVSSKTLVESVYLDCTDVDDIKIAARLLPATHNASAQLAYLPPRTALLTVTNPTSL